jgi:hypothetical protein
VSGVSVQNSLNVMTRQSTPDNTGFFVPEILASNAAIMCRSAPVASDLKQA